MPVYEERVRACSRIPALWFAPEWDGPWKLSGDRSHFYRFTTGGTIYRLDVEDGDVRSY